VVDGGRGACAVMGSNLSGNYFLSGKNGSPGIWHDFMWVFRSQELANQLLDQAVEPAPHLFHANRFMELVSSCARTCKKELVLFTGILDPPETLVRALTAVVQSGKRFIVYAADGATHCGSSDLRESALLSGGVDVRIHRTKGQNFHIKAWVVDGEQVWMGSCNLAIRSLTIDEEIMVKYTGNLSYVSDMHKWAYRNSITYEPKIKRFVLGKILQLLNEGLL
jgi:hypothetical protein